jgi:predicted HTH domain antitoxin
MEDKDLSVLLPGIEVTVAGENMSIQPFPFVKIPKAVALIGKLGNLVFDVIKAVRVNKANLDELDNIDLIVYAAEKGIVIPEEIKEDAEQIRQVIVANSPAEDVQISGNKLSLSEEALSSITKLFEEGGDSLFELVKLGAGRNQEWLEKLNAAEGIDVTLGIIEANIDFFKKSLSPILATRMSRIMGNL